VKAMREEDPAEVADEEMELVEVNVEVEGGEQ
jgi:hypothetical protein